MDLKALGKPFNAASISWRIGSTNGDKTKGMALAYLDARDVMIRLDEVCGPENWQCRYPFAGCCEIAICVGTGLQGAIWVTKSNGAGQSDIEAEKGQFSDAFKRAAVLWSIGRYLYDLPNTWVPIEKRGNSYIFSDATIGELTSRLDKWQTRYFNEGP